MTNEPDKTDVLDSDCLEAFDHLYSYLNGEIKDQATLARIEHHLQHCKSCFSRAQMEKELDQRIRESGHDRAPDALKQRLDNLLDKL